jgi:hypothetical protein
MHCPCRQTAHGATTPGPHGWQQSEVAEHPGWKNGMQATHTPLTSGLVCLQTSPGPHTGGGPKMLPPHGPPAPETHSHAVVPGNVSQLAPVGHIPPQVPGALAPQGRTQRAAGPGQQVNPPAGVAQMHPCSHMPLRQVSTEHGLPSSQSLSVWHAC